jgi:hypothetical protein
VQSDDISIRSTGERMDPVSSVPQVQGQPSAAEEQAKKRRPPPPGEESADQSPEETDRETPQHRVDDLA